MKFGLQMLILGGVLQARTFVRWSTPVALAESEPRAAVLARRAIRSMPLSQFQSGLGIAIHIEYTDGKYADVPKVLEDLRYLGILNVRDGIPNPGWLPPGQGLAAMKYLAAHGVRFDFLSSCNSKGIEATMASLDSLAREFHGIALSVEGTNEINNEACAVGGGSNEENGQRWQKRLYAAVHADPLMQNVPVLYMTGAEPRANLTGFADQANTHPYPSQGAQPHDRLMSDFIREFPGSASTGSRQITETGYATDLSDNPNAVGEATQAALGLNVYFDAAWHGISRTFLYQLLAAYPTQNGDTGLGLFRYDGSPKMLATHLHTLSVLMPKDRVSSTRPVEAMMTGVPSTTYQLALTASDGSIYVFAWNEVPVWDAMKKVPLPYVHVHYRLSLPGHWTAEYLDPGQKSAMPVEATQDGTFSAWLEAYPTALHFIPQKTQR